MAIFHLKEEIDRPMPGYISSGGLERCINWLYIQIGLLKAIARFAEDRLRKLGFAPSAFTMTDESENPILTDWKHSPSADWYLCFVGLEASIGGIHHIFYVSYDDMESDDDEYNLGWLMFRRSDSGTQVYDNFEGKWASCPEEWIDHPEDADSEYQDFM